MDRLGIDIGGSGIKAAMVDTSTGALVSDRILQPTPKPPTPAALSAAVAAVVGALGDTGPEAGCSFPTVVVDGVVRTAGNLDPAWPGTHVDTLLEASTGLAVRALNDADAAGIAEMRLGAGHDLTGTVLMITIGTGLGSGLFRDGHLVPNTELGWMPGPDGRRIELLASGRVRVEQQLGWSEWGDRFDRFLRQVERVMTPDHLIIGGGASEQFDRFVDRLHVDATVRPARFANDAGIIGAALVAAGTDIRPLRGPSGAA